MTIFAPVARKARPGATARFSLITVAVLAVSLPAWGVYQWWAFRHRLRIDWNISGPACPIATHSWQSVALSRRPMTFDYGGMHIAHPFGGAKCSPVPEDYFTAHAYSVCQLTGPAMISVTAGGRTVLYEPGFGRPATVKIRNGQVTCVRGGWFRE